MRVSVIGAGYVGIVTGVCLAKLGNEITLVDASEDKVTSIRDKIPPVYEKGLAELLNEVSIKASSNYQSIGDAELIFICVGTPCSDDGFVMLDQIEKAAQQIGRELKRKEEYCAVCVKSSVVPMTTEKFVIPILEASGKKVGRDFGACMSPEFLREGKAVYDFMNPARLIIGEYDRRSGDMLTRLYKNFNAPVLRTTLRTAEMIKLASNAFLATKISFANEIGNVCKRLGIDVYEVTSGMGFDDRIGSKFLNAGIGFGGSCLPKDLRALISQAKQTGYEPRLLREILRLNDKQALQFVELLKRHIALKDATIGILGLAFKPGTDDVRDSRAIEVVKTLLQEGAIVKAYDPVAMETFKRLFPQIEYVPSEEILNCDAVLIITEWEEFNHLDYRGKIVIDGRRILKAKEARIYEGICW